MKLLVPTKGRNPQYLNEYETFTHKQCNVCKEIKEVSAFLKSKSANRLGWCYRGYCKDCGNSQTREYSKSNRPQRNTRLKNWRKNSPELARKNDKKKSLKQRYNISLEQAETLKNSNNSKCWICDRKHDKMYIDHIHGTKKVRGMLCPRCNSYLGYIKDNSKVAQKIIDYLSGLCHADVLLELATKAERHYRERSAALLSAGLGAENLQLKIKYNGSRKPRIEQR